MTYTPLGVPVAVPVGGGVVCFGGALDPALHPAGMPSSSVYSAEENHDACSSSRKCLKSFRPAQQESGAQAPRRNCQQALARQHLSCSHKNLPDIRFLADCVQTTCRWERQDAIAAADGFAGQDQ